MICRVFKPEAMLGAIEKAFPGNYIQLQRDEWLVSAPGTAREVSDRLGVTVNGKVPQPDNIDAAIILSVTSYYGRASNEIWEWLKAKMERPDG